MDCTTEPQELQIQLFTNSTTATQQILKTKWFVPQMDLAGKPWFHRLVEAKSREGQKLRRRWLIGDFTLEGMQFNMEFAFAQKHDQFSLQNILYMTNLV